MIRVWHMHTDGIIRWGGYTSSDANAFYIKQRNLA